MGLSGGLNHIAFETIAAEIIQNGGKYSSTCNRLDLRRCLIHSEARGHVTFLRSYLNAI